METDRRATVIAGGPQGIGGGLLTVEGDITGPATAGRIADAALGRFTEYTAADRVQHLAGPIRARPHLGPRPRARAPETSARDLTRV